jgi:nucleoside-diphosphate-sugar epimerase
MIALEIMVSMYHTRAKFFWKVLPSHAMLRMQIRQDPYANDAVMRCTWRTSMTTLITGGMGFIGLHTARAFLDAGEDVVITYFQTWREPSFIKDEYHKRVQIEKVDVTDRDGLMTLGKKHKIDRIAHLAVPGLGALGPVDDLRTNITGLTHVLEAALAWGSKRLTLASSVAVYAGLSEGPFMEDALLPIPSGNPTETFKKAWEILALHFASRTGLEIISMRIGGIWGPLYHSMANLPSRLTHAAVKGTDPDLASTRGGVPFAEDGGDMCYVKTAPRASSASPLPRNCPTKSTTSAAAGLLPTGSYWLPSSRLCRRAPLKSRRAAAPGGARMSTWTLAGLRQTRATHPGTRWRQGCRTMWRGSGPVMPGKSARRASANEGKMPPHFALSLTSSYGATHG